MNKVAIAVAILSATALSSTTAHADVTGASTTLTKNVAQECNIGLLATSNDGDVGDPVSNVGGQYVHSEINDFTGAGQSISGKALCNASGGYTIHVTATNGSLENNDASGSQGVEYTLSEGNFDKLAVGTIGSDYNPSQGEIMLLAEGATTEIASFQLIMKLADNESFTYAGQYTETLTFDLTPL